MSELIRAIQERKIGRRTFLGWGAAAAGAAALTGVGTGLIKVGPATADAAAAPEEGKWITAACWHNCGGRCLNKVLVKDGVVVRQKTDDSHPDSPDYPQQRGCARGRSQRKQVFAVDRLRYPMKRKNWEPGGGKKELRGKDEWVRISWDEALEIIASETKRIAQKYGNRAILLGGGSEIARTLALAGGYTNHWGTTSWGTWRWGPAKFGMAEGFSTTSINDRFDLRNSQLIVIWGANPAWSAQGNPTYNYLQAKKAGARFIIIDPIRTQSAELLADEWIPIHPGTDHAMLLGMAHTLITEDDPARNKLIDWDFLNRCTVGFDAAHMPEGADPKENFKDYVLGTYDGTPKTAEWAAEICGVEAGTIRRLAREIATTRRAALLTGWAAARIRNADSWPQMFMTFGAMTGHMGESGRMTGVSCHYHTSNGGPVLARSGGAGVPGIKNPVTDNINDSELWDAVLNGKYTKGYGEVEQIDIQMIYHGYGATLQTRDGMTRGIEAHRKVEFVVTQGHFLTTNALYSDVVLPATTPWEREGGLLTGSREMIIFYRKVAEPLFEAKSDQWIAIELGKKLGFEAEKVYPISEKQQLFNQLAGATVIKASGSGYEPLVTITEADIAEWGVTGKPQQGRITLKEFEERGIYQVERRPGDNFGFIAYEAFRKDPEKNALKTASGKLEIHCRALADLIKGYGWTEVDPIPTYNPATEGYEETFKDWKGKVKGEFPLQAVNPHYLRRSHSIFDNVGWLRESFPNHVYISSQDAAARGIQNGDTVLISSRHGKVLRPATVTESVMPGVVGVPHGAWVEMDEKLGVDRAGADNILCGGLPSGQGTSAWNSCLVQVERFDQPLEPDHTWALRIPLT
ncbi:MAG: molybdopterin-dependent oxidoreductase [Bacillota bacterium]